VPSILVILAAFSLIAFAGAAAGVWFSGMPEVSRRAIPLGGAVLIAVAVFGVLPELAQTFGWAIAAALLFAGVLAVGAFDRYVHPVCPACSHTHDHDDCGTRLHGFASPLVIAAVLHSLFDGWALAAGYDDPGARALSIGVAVHKLPEGLALGVILRAALPSRGEALGWAAVTQAATIAGGLLEYAAAPALGERLITLLLALAGGMFLYLGLHAIHGEWRRRVAQRHAPVS
jgi:zinc and cadmium transporter